MRIPAFRAAAALLGVSALGALGGCGSLQSSDNFLGLITPYRVEVVQGNVLTKEMVAQVRPGLTRNQVRDILGSPLLTDPFHADRWDYVFTIRRQGAEPQRRSVVLYFEGDVVQGIEGGKDLPTEAEFVASIDTFKTQRNAPPLTLTEEQLAKLPVPPKAAPVSAEPEGPAPNRIYPPLESAR